MPTPAEILAGLAAIANQHRWLAVAWHVALAAVALALLARWRPDRRLAGVLLALPLVSVSALAWLHGNPFNGTTFALFAAALAALAARLPRARVAIAPAWCVGLGLLLFAFGWVYPHFLRTDSALTYLYAAPTGLVPCPTLSATIGLALVLGGLGSRAWSLTLGAAGLLYGVFGALRLGVLIDALLLLGALGICGVGLWVAPSREPPARP